MVITLVLFSYNSLNKNRVSEALNRIPISCMDVDPPIVLHGSYIGVDDTFPVDSMNHNIFVLIAFILFLFNLLIFYKHTS